jgi:hypothetical protein
MKTLAEINQEHGRRASEILTAYMDATEAIRAERGLEEGRYLDELTPEQRMRILRECNVEEAQEAYRETYEAYTAEVERYENQLAQRRTHLKKSLFAVEGSEGAAALSRTVLASEEELAAYLDVAIQADNEDLARTVFVAAERKELGELLFRYFDDVNPEARALYQEWTKLPTQEDLERRRESIERIVRPPDYDWLIPPLSSRV